MRTAKTALVLFLLASPLALAAKHPCVEAARAPNDANLKACFESRRVARHHATDESRGYAIAKVDCRRFRYEAKIRQICRSEYGVQNFETNVSYAVEPIPTAACTATDIGAGRAKAVEALVAADDVHANTPSGAEAPISEKVRRVCRAFGSPNPSEIRHVECRGDGLDGWQIESCAGYAD